MDLWWPFLTLSLTKNPSIWAHFGVFLLNWTIWCRKRHSSNPDYLQWVSPSWLQVTLSVGNLYKGQERRMLLFFPLALIADKSICPLLRHCFTDIRTYLLWFQWPEDKLRHSALWTTLGYLGFPSGGSHSLTNWTTTCKPLQQILYVYIILYDIYV